MLKKPLISKDLIAHLTELFPVRPPEPDDTDREIWMEVGRQRLITYLKSTYDNQQKRGEFI